MHSEKPLLPGTSTLDMLAPPKADSDCRFGYI